MKNHNNIITGKYGSAVNFANLQTSIIVFEDIIERLAAINRFNGGTQTLYTVAQHSLLMQQLLLIVGASHKVQQLALMHDMTEAFMGDMVSPLKSMFPQFATMEDELFDVICQQLNVPNDFSEDDWEYVKLLDKELRLLEWYTLNGRKLYDHAYAWREIYGPSPYLDEYKVGKIEEMSSKHPERVIKMFTMSWGAISELVEQQREQEAK